MEFQIGEKVVYPNQGVGTIEQISSRNITGQPEMFYLLKLTTNGLRVMVPMTNVLSVGLRRVAKGRDIGVVLEYLNHAAINPHHDWKGRFKENSEKMRSGSLLEIAEVFKALLVLSQDKPLSFREKKMLDRSWQLLVDEISAVKAVGKETAEALLLKTLLRANLKMQLPS